RKRDAPPDRRAAPARGRSYAPPLRTPESGAGQGPGRTQTGGGAFGEQPRRASVQLRPAGRGVGPGAGSRRIVSRAGPAESRRVPAGFGDVADQPGALLERVGAAGGGAGPGAGSRRI